MIKSFFKRKFPIQSRPSQCPISRRLRRISYDDHFCHFHSTKLTVESPRLSSQSPTKVAKSDGVRKSSVHNQLWKPKTVSVRFFITPCIDLSLSGIDCLISEFVRRIMFLFDNWIEPNCIPVRRKNPCWGIIELSLFKQNISDAIGRFHSPICACMHAWLRNWTTCDRVVQRSGQFLPIINVAVHRTIEAEENKIKIH